MNSLEKQRQYILSRNMYNDLTIELVEARKKSCAYDK